MTTPTPGSADWRPATSIVDHIVVDQDEKGALSDALSALPEGTRRPQLIIADQ